MRNLFAIILLSGILLACSKEKEVAPVFPINKEIIGLASPIQLGPEGAVVHLYDYFISPEKIDSFSVPKGVNLSRDENILTLEGELNSAIAALSAHMGDTVISIPLKANRKVYYQFSIPLKGDFETVEIKGNFNGWNPGASVMEIHGERWEYGRYFFPAEYQYLLVIDGKEMLDPFNDDSVDNGSGGYNSRVIIGNPDAQTPFIYGSSFADGEIRIKYDQPLDGIEAFWDNFKIPGSMISNGDKEIIIRIPKEASEIKRSHIRVWGFNKNGLSNDMLVPLENGRVITDVSSLDRTDQHTYSMYFLMVDRFFNGNENNDKTVDDPMIKPLANYMGGDIAGVEKKLQEGYFDSLGMNTVWLSPIGLNPEGAWGWWDKGGVQSKFSGYHGYWPAQSKAVDYRFGTAEELQSLIAGAHDNNKNILLDYVANHVHKDHPVYQQNPDWATELYLPDGTLNTEKWDEHRLTTWFDTFLPTLDLENPEVTEAMSDSALYWFENFQIDGFRHDATKHIPEIFWRTLTRKLKTRVMLPENRSIYQIGETYGNAELIGSYVNTGQLDAQFDFNVYDRAISVLTNEENEMLDLAAQLRESLTFYGYHNLMGYISGNQDRPRFISLADGSVDPAIDTKLQGWTKDIDNNGDIGFKRLAQLHAFNFTIPGIPVIYYGDEIGMPGGNDPDNRRMMIFDDLNEDQLKMKETVSKLAKLRSQNMALLYGDLRIIDVDEFTLTFERRYFNEKVVVIFNNVSRKKNFAIPDAAHLEPVFGSKKSQGNGHAVISLEPHGFEILTN